MPELPDVCIYIEALAKRVQGRVLQSAAVRSPFVLRTFDPPLENAEGRVVQAVERLGKRIVLALDGDLFLVIHLMIAGRLRWFDGPPTGLGKIELVRFTFESGTLAHTEAGTTRRASIHLVAGRQQLAEMDPGGLEVIGSMLEAFRQRLVRENRTLKRALADPALFSGVGNAYSDEILHAAKLSPIKLTRTLTAEEISGLHRAAQETLTDWTRRLRREFGLDKGLGRFPGAGEVTAFRPDFAVHGRFGEACRVCGSMVQRIVRADNECNYCPGCQTGGKVLADRSLSRLLKEDWGKEMAEE